MKAQSHQKVVALAVESAPSRLRPLLDHMRDGIDLGASLTDEFRMYWDMDNSGKKTRVRMHRCYMDSSDPKDRGCAVQITRYVDGIPGFFDQWESGELEGAYDEEEFLVNAGAFLGVLSHHIADLHTPVHVGSSLPLSSVGYRKRAGLHSRVEADLDYAAATIDGISPYTPRPQEFNIDMLETTAQRIFDDYYLRLSDIYGPLASPPIRAAFFAGCIVDAAKLTADSWMTVFGRVDKKALDVWLA